MTEVGKVRQSQLVSTFGVGALIASGDQSFLICGLDEWDERRCPPVEEPRLANSLGVLHFRAPSTEAKRGDVPVVRFPEMHQCPECRRLEPFWKFDAKKMRCQDCDRVLTPSRFVACCEDGHLEEFPYFQWVHRSRSKAEGNHRLSIRTRGTSSSLADIVISCSCGAPARSMEGSFARHALPALKRCSGQRPWLPDAGNESCDKPLRALQRGAANVWFSEVRSSISIPPWSSPNARFVSRQWELLQSAPVELIRRVVADAVARDPLLDVEGIVELVLKRRGVAHGMALTEAELRAEEYRALKDGHESVANDTFKCFPVDVAPSLTGLIAQVSKVTRLREVRALTGFSRVTPGGGGRKAGLSEVRKNWFPAVEVFGEGVFVMLDEEWLRAWEKKALVVRRGEALEESVARRASESGASHVDAPNARFLGIHTFSHALLKELSLDAGYPTGALRERVYADAGQCGVLIYTASSDAAGSLGGLAALADEEPFETILRNAASRSAWCSNDPVCSESGPSGSDGLNLAACHACLLLPETSCEHRNIFLDRVMVSGGTDGDVPGILGDL